MAHENEGDWGEYRRLILQELQRLHEGIADIQRQIASMHAEDLAKIRSEIAVLQFKSGVWGFIAGAIPGAVTLVYVAVRN